MLVLFAGYIVPRLNRFKAKLTPSLVKEELLIEESRKYLFKFYTGLDIVHIGALVNVVLALWKPFY
jgi:hypothetical protein